MRMRILFYCHIAACLGVIGCTYTSAPTRPLSSSVTSPNAFYLSTSHPKEPYETVAFLQVERVGATAAGYADIGGIDLDTATFRHLMSEATRYGADGVVIVDFEDVDPPNEAERAMAMANSIQEGKVKTRERKIRFHVELIRRRRQR